MNMMLIAAVAAASVLTAVMVRKYSPDIALVLSIAGAVVVTLFSLEGLSELIDETKVIASSINPDYFSVPVKALGISLLTTATSKLCEDAGDKAIAFTVTFAGKTAVLISAMPLFSELIGMLSGILKLE